MTRDALEGKNKICPSPGDFGSHRIEQKHRHMLSYLGRLVVQWWSVSPSPVIFCEIYYMIMAINNDQWSSLTFDLSVKIDRIGLPSIYAHILDLRSH